MSFTLSARSLRRLEGVHPDLVRVIKRAIQTSTVDFTVLEGVRTLATQRKYVATGKSKTMNSRHLTGHAVDIAPVVNGSVSWNWDHFYPLADAVKAAAKAEGVPITWGGDWRSFKDGPHWELPWAQYPKN
jgi:peptidoglycan L-alanyl-D-glutamate endopeptidase CwlK